MKRIYPLFFLMLALAQVAGSQNLPASAKTNQAAIYRPHLPVPEAAIPDGNQPFVPNQPAAITRDVEVELGNTYWDAQNYGTLSRRILSDGNGDPVAFWIHSHEATGHSDRGTGRTERKNGTWSPVSARIESKRTGFPEVAKMGDGTELVVSHNTAVTPFAILLAKKAPGATNWTEINVPGIDTMQVLWPKIAVGGPTGSTLHLLAITQTDKTYAGVRGLPIYYRSPDGGQTWDKVNVIIPGLDSTHFNGVGADQYIIDAQGSTVAVGVFTDWSDVLVFKSEDNGENWTTHTVLDFPDVLEDYVAAPGNSYSETDIPLDTLAPGPLATLNCDNTGALLLDNQGKVHVWFGRMYVQDSDFSDTNTEYFPTTNGICYWNEDYATGQFQIVGGALDYNGNGFLDISNAQVQGYGGTNVGSWPIAGLDAQGNIFLAYAALHELYLATGDFGEKFLRRVYLIKSTDGGNSWGDVLEVNNAPYLQDTFFVSFIECMYHTIPKNIGPKIWLLYEQDFVPGSTIWGGPASQEQTSLRWVEIDPADVPTDAHEPGSKFSNLKISIAPNPASDWLHLNADLKNSQPVRVDIFDWSGKLKTSLNFPAGERSGGFDIPVSGFEPGVYAVRVREGLASGVVKFLKR